MEAKFTARAFCLTVALAVTGCSSDHGTAAGHGSSSGQDVPNAPSELKVVEAAGGAHLTWMDNSNNEAGFMIERKPGTNSFTVIETVPADTKQYHDTKITPGLSYRYRVMAMGKNGHAQSSGYSNEVVFQAPGAGTAPGPDGGGTADAGGASDTPGTPDTGNPSDAGTKSDSATTDGASGKDVKDAADAADTGGHGGGHN